MSVVVKRSEQALSAAPSIVRRARELLAESYALLPDDYFRNKDARSYRFNTVTRLVERRAPAPNDSAAAAITSELARVDAAGLYVGVPWCAQICAFCNFAYSTSKDPTAHDDYIAALAQELELLQHAGLRRTTTVYFGGGTPTVLSDERFSAYLDAILRRLDLAPDASVTCEATISTLTDEKLAIMRARGITRLSMGVQSLDPDVRTQARLIGSAEQALTTLAAAREAFDMFNVDLIYGYPYQSAESWLDTITRIADLELPSITLYRLEVKERTTNLKLYRRDAAAFQDELAARLAYFIAALVLEERGYVEHPLGWWIRRDRHARSQTWRQHMRGWSTAAPYLGIGQGAFSLGASFFHDNHQDLAAWRESIAAGRLPVASRRPLDERDAYMNRLFRALRTVQHVNVDGGDPELERLGLTDLVRAVVERQVEYGLMDHVDGAYWLTLAGRSLVHWILDELADALNAHVGGTSA